MKKVIAVSVLLAALAASPTYAEKGFSAGASLGYSNIGIEDSGLSADFNDVGYKVFGTWMFSDNWGIEGGWVDFGTPSESVLGSTIDLDTDGFDLFLVGALPMSDTFDLFAKAGVLSWDVSGSIDGMDLGSDSGEDIALGIGGRFRGKSGFGLRSEFEWFDIEDSDSAWMFSVGFEYAFK